MFASALSGLGGAQQDATPSCSVPTIRRASTSSSAATEPDEASDSDSDSQRSRHRAVELVDAAAGYASIYEPPAAGNEEAATSSDEATSSKACVAVKATEEPPPAVTPDSGKNATELGSSCEQALVENDVVVSSNPMPETITATSERASTDSEAKKAAVRGISDVQVRLICFGVCCSL